MKRDALISIDWGSTRVRARLVRTSDLSVLAEHRTDEGVTAFAHLDADARRAAQVEALNRCIFRVAKGAAAPTILSGMAGSTLGMVNVPYAKLPLSLATPKLEYREIPEVPGAVVVGGVASEDDVMRGEEVQLIGLARALPELIRRDAVLLLPGTHSKHAVISSGQLTRFRTFMTGELFATLSKHGTLSNVVDAEVDSASDGFIEGVVMSAEPLQSTLFGIRARALLNNHSRAHAGAMLSGLLIGAELRTLLNVDATFHIVATGTLANAYANAARELGLTLHFIDPALAEMSAVHGHLVIAEQL